MGAVAPEYHRITTEEVRNSAVDFTAVLDSGETLSGTPTIQGSEDLNISNQQVNSSELEINGVSVAVGKAVLFTVSGMVVGRYKIDIKCSTSASQTLERAVTLGVVATLQS